MSSPSQSSSAPSLKDLRAARGKPPSGLRRFRKWIIAGGLLVLLILFGFFGLPPIIKAQTIKQLSARLGREVKIEKIYVNPLVLSASIEGFSIAEAARAGGDFTGWRRLYVNFDSWSLFTGEIRFQEIVLDGFHAHVAKGREGGLNFDDIVARLTAPDVSAAEPKDPKKKPTPFAVGKLDVTDAKVSFDDASRSQAFATAVGPLTFSLTNFRTVGDPNSPYQFEAVTSAGERLAWKGTVSADPVRSQGQLILGNIDLARLSPYYQELVRGELRSAFADLSGRYTFEMKNGAPVLTLADGAFTLRDVRFGAPGETADAFSLKRLAITGVNADSVALKAAIAKVAIEGVKLKATRDAAGIDFLRLVQPAHPAASPSNAPAAVASNAGSVVSTTGTAPPAGPGPVVTLGEFSLSGVQVELTDLTTPRRAEHRIEDLTLTLRDLNLADLAKAIPVSLDIKLPQEGRIAASGTLAPQPFAADLDVVVENVPFANASPYLEPFLNIRLAGGTVRAQGKVAVRDGKTDFAGDFGIGGLATVDGKLAQDFVKWTDFAVTGIKFKTAPMSFHAGLVRLVDPSALIRIEADGSLSITQVEKIGPEKPKAPPEPVAVVRMPEDHPATKPQVGTFSGPVVPENPLPLAITIDRFEIQEGAFRYEDRSIKPAAHGALLNFTGFVSGLSSENLGRADVDLKGKVDGVAPVAISGKLNPLGRPAFVDLKIDFKGIDLQPGAGPYIGKFAGRELSRGNLNVAIKAKLEERKVDASNVVTLDQFYLGPKNNSPEATKLPVGLALSLLRDTDGKIVVDLPVKGSLDDPAFKVGRVVLRVLTNVLVKAATSPFSLLGAAFGGGGDELGWQDFEVGSARLDEGDVKKLETVAKALNARPALSLDIVGAYDPTNDLAALRFARLDDKVRAAAWETRRLTDPNTPPPEQLDITPQLHAGMVAKLYAEAFPPAEGSAMPVVVSTERGAEVKRPLVPPPAPAPVVAPETEARSGSRLSVGRLPRFYSREYKGSAPERVNAPAIEAPAPKAPEPALKPETVAKAEGAAETPAAPGVPTITVDEMEARLAARIEIPPAELHAVGEGRAQAIRAWLLETGKVAPERVFLAPVAETGTRVNLNLK